MLVAYAEGDPEMQARLTAFRQGLEQLGWSEGRNIRFDIRFAPAGAGQEHSRAQELVALKPDVIFAHTPQVVASLQRESRAIPVVFVGVADPVGAGFVASLNRPGGNLAGFLGIEASIAGKWLTMLREIAPITRVALIANPKNIFDYFVGAAEPVARSLSIELVPSRVGNAAEIEHAIVSFASGKPMAAWCCRRMQRPALVAISLSRSQPSIACPRSTHSVYSSGPAVACLTASTSSIRTGRQHPMLTASCAGKARGPAGCTDQI